MAPHSNIQVLSLPHLPSPLQVPITLSPSLSLESPGRPIFYLKYHLSTISQFLLSLSNTLYNIRTQYWVVTKVFRPRPSTFPIFILLRLSFVYIILKVGVCTFEL